MRFIRWFDQIGMNDIPLVGGKNASLGEMIMNVTEAGVRIPAGFAITVDAYWHYIQHNTFLEQIKQIMNEVSTSSDVSFVCNAGKKVRTLLEGGTLPEDIISEISLSYKRLCDMYDRTDLSVAVRSSATAEDLPTASFAGQQDTFLHIRGEQSLMHTYKQCIASLFTDRAITYRIAKKFDHWKVGLSVGVQKMVHSDNAVSGVAFSLEMETGFKDVITIEASYGLGEAIVQGIVTPDEYLVYKPMLQEHYNPIIKKQKGDKSTKMVYQVDKKKISLMPVAYEKQSLFALSNDEIITLAHYVSAIELYYSERKGSWCPMDIEWAKDSDDGLIYIVQARPETIHRGEKTPMLQTYVITGDTLETLVSGLSVGQKIVSGVARVITTIHDIKQVRPGDIIVTDMTNPDFVPVMKIAAGIITNRGGRTCHAAIVSRELGIPALVGSKNATEKIYDGSVITLDCSQGITGYVYNGSVPFVIHKTVLQDVTMPKKPKIMVNCADPSTAFRSSLLPVAGVGLARIEFIIANYIQVHPMALIYPEQIQDPVIHTKIDELTAGYESKKGFFVEQLSYGIGSIAAAFFPRPVYVRFSDFKTNEYRNLLGGSFFETTKEENPMLGFRGASRYYDKRYREAFIMECISFMKVRNEMGLKNVHVMIPFVRTVDEAKKVLELMDSEGLVRGKDGLQVIIMCEVPSNVLLIDQFSILCDGFSIGSNDLTQLTLGVDRDSEILGPLFDERDKAVQCMLDMAIKGAHQAGKYIGICGQAPSDYPEVAHFLIQCGIDSLSLNADVVQQFLRSI